MSEEIGQSSFNYAAAKDWDDFPKELWDLSSVFSSNNKVFKYFLDANLEEHNCTAR